MAEPLHKLDRAGQPVQSSASTRAASIAEVMAPGHGFTSVTDKIRRSSCGPASFPAGCRVHDRVRGHDDVPVHGHLPGVHRHGIWGVNIPVGWGFDIVNFVWWIGIGHAGTLISAILLLFRQRWRMSIARCAEAMTLFAVACAGMFPVLHTGRPWLAYWLFPYRTPWGSGPSSAVR